MNKRFLFLLVFIATFIFLGQIDLFAASTSSKVTTSWKQYVNMDSLIKLLISFLIAVLSMATKSLVKFINVKISEAQNRTTNILAKNAFGLANRLLEELIMAESEKIKDMIQKILADGKVTKEEKEEFIKAIEEEAYRILGEHGLKNLEQFIGDSREWIRKKISAFLEVKLQDTLNKK